MQSERYDSIEYNDEWESIPVVRAEPLNSQYDYEQDEEDDYEEDYDTYSGQNNGYKNFEDIKPKKGESTPQPVIKLQFLLAFLVLVASFVLKNYGGDLYTTVSQWYFDNLNNSLIVTMKSQGENSLDSEETTENSISATDITEQAKSETQPENTSTQPTDITEETSTEAPSNDTTSEAPTEASTEIADTTQPTETNGVEDEY